MRKSVARRSSRLNEQSHQSQISCVLDPDSNVGIEDEGAPLWFKDLENNSVSARRSARFRMFQDNTPLLDSDSEPDSMPRRKSWWKDLDDSPEIRGVGSDMVGEKSVPSERSPVSVESSDASSAESGVAKQKSALRRDKRRSVSKAMFSHIFESSEDSVGSEKVDPSARGRDERAPIASPSSSDGDESIEKVRKLPFKKKIAATGKLADLERRSVESLSNVFRNALDASRSTDDARGGGALPNILRNSLRNRGGSPACSTNSVETIKLQLEHLSPRSSVDLTNESRDPESIEDEDDDAESLDLGLKPRSKRRRILAERSERKSPNFEDLLDDESEDGSGDRRWIDEEEDESNRNKAGHRLGGESRPEIGVQSTVAEGESGAADSIRKRRAGFPRERRRNWSETTVGQVPESRNASVHMEPINVRKQTEEFRHPRRETASPGIERWSGNARTDRVSSSSLSNAGAKAKNGPRSESRTSPAGGVGVVDDSGDAGLLAMEKRYRAKNPGSSSAEVEKRRTPRSRSFLGRHGSVREESSSSQLGLSRKGSSDRAERSARESGDGAMGDESPAEQSGGETDNGEDLASTSGFIDRGHTGVARSGPRGSRSAGKPSTKVLPDSVEEPNTDSEEAEPSAEPKTVALHHREETLEATRPTDRRSRNKGNRLHGTEDTAERDFVDATLTSGRLEAKSSTKRADSSSRVGRVVDAARNGEQISKIRAALEDVKEKEFALMKTSRIDSYFQRIAKRKTDLPVQPAQKPRNKTMSGGENKNKTSPVRRDKAYLVNGKVYQKPKLPRPKSWATDRLYRYLWRLMEPKYGLKTRIRSEQFIIKLSEVVSLVTRRKKYDNYKAELDDLIREMARLGIIKTRNEFHIFCREFLHYEFRVKVIPMILPGNVRNIPFEPDKLHTPVLEA